MCRLNCPVRFICFRHGILGSSQRFIGYGLIRLRVAAACEFQPGFKRFHQFGILTGPCHVIIGFRHCHIRLSLSPLSIDFRLVRCCFGIHCRRFRVLRFRQCQSGLLDEFHILAGIRRVFRLSGLCQRLVCLNQLFRSRLSRLGCTGHILLRTYHVCLGRCQRIRGAVTPVQHFNGSFGLCQCLLGILKLSFCLSDFILCGLGAGCMKRIHIGLLYIVKLLFGSDQILLSCFTDLCLFKIGFRLLNLIFIPRLDRFLIGLLRCTGLFGRCQVIPLCIQNISGVLQCLRRKIAFRLRFGDLSLSLVHFPLSRFYKCIYLLQCLCQFKHFRCQRLCRYSAGLGRLV